MLLLPHFVVLLHEGENVLLKCCVASILLVNLFKCLAQFLIVFDSESVEVGIVSDRVIVGSSSIRHFSFVPPTCVKQGILLG